MATIDFGIFDHLDRRPEIGLGQTYEDRFKLVEAYDKAGFVTYHIAEHHATPLTVAPAPSVFLAAIAQRTKRIRFGPMVYVLPLHHPLRLAEEICMLDHMSNGRLDLGVGRGVSAFELDLYGVDPQEARSIYDEAKAIIMQAFVSDTLTFHGRHYDFEDVPIGLHPIQQPHPRLWIGIGTPDGADRAGAAGANVLTNSPLAPASGYMQRFRDSFEASHPGDPLPLQGFCRHTIVAETDAEAEKIMREAYGHWYRHFVHLHHAKGGEPVIAQYIEDFEETVRRDLLVFGSPATVRETIERYLETSGTNFFCCRFAFGSLSYAQSRDALDGFVEEVMPYFREKVAIS